ncbi:MAG TPA: sulfatase [Haliangiales bacterium]|nr:sulfatase [Haliangiales bacterium]
MSRGLLLLCALVACAKSPDREPPAAAARGAAAPHRDEHPIYSLIDNRLLAHVEHQGGLVVFPGSPAFAKYLRFAKPRGRIPWTLRAERDGRRVAIAERYAAMAVPLAGGERWVWARLWSPAAQRMTIQVAGRPASTVELVEGWQTAAVALPAGALKEGENDVQLAFGAKDARAAVEWIQIGGEAPPPETPVVYDPARRALRLLAGMALTYYVLVPAGARLVADTTCPVAVTATAADGTRVAGKLDGGVVDLAPLAGKAARLRLEATCPVARLTGAALALAGPAPAVPKPARRPRHIVLWVMDSLRADRVRPWTPHARPDAPTFEALARTSTVFTAAYAQGNESRGSYASIWTSLYPAVHGMIEAGAHIEDRWVTLGEAMQAAGFYTAGVTANGYVAAYWGFGVGWDMYANHIHLERGLRGEDVLAAGLAALQRERARPVFLYLGTVDTHVSWRGKEPWLSRYDPRPYGGRFAVEATGADVDRIGAGKLGVSERDKERIIALYDSNVSYQDEMLRRLVDGLGVDADDTMIVVTADHGDELFEDGRVGHGGSLRESLVHVPLLVHYPPLFPATTVDDAVEGVDLLPTLLDAAGFGAPEDAQGASLLPLAHGVGRGYARAAVSSQFEVAHAVRLGRWKLRVSSNGVPALFDLVDDPGERRDVAASRPVERRLLTDALSTFLVYQKLWKKARWGTASNALPALADDLEH